MNINKKFKKIESYLIKIDNDLDKGVFTFQVGFPRKWFFKSNDIIECEKVADVDEGNGIILNIRPKNSEIYVDETLNFIMKTIDTNNRIAEMEEMFVKKIEEEKKKMRDEVKDFYSQIENFKEDSFEDLDDENNINSNLEKIKAVSEEFEKISEEQSQKDDEENGEVKENDLKKINPDDINKKTNN